jgi:hypothetical protein
MKLVFVALVLLLQVHQDEGARWRLRRGKQGVKMAIRHESLLFARQTVHQGHRQGLRYKTTNVMQRIHKTAYWGQVSLGSPLQHFKVIFDTGSGNLIIPSSDCNVPGCKPHHKYERKSSTTAMTIQNEKGEGNAEISFGTGQISGDFYRDKMCIGDSLCIDSSFIAADKESTEPFQEIPFDGIMGLGFKDLSMGEGFNIVDDLYAKGQLPQGQISFYLTDGGDSEVTFGGYKPEYLASDIVWAPVKKESYWQVSIDDITFDNQPKNLCPDGCEVAVDTGTSMLAGPSDLVDKLSNMLGAKEDCSNYNGLPKLGFQIGDKVLNLKPDDYMDSSTNDCSFSLMALDVPPPKGPLFIFGDPFLRRFVTIFDRTAPRVGFAVAKHSDDNTPARELISHVGVAGGGEAGPPPAGGESPNSVDLHLDSGLMGPGQSSDDDSSSPSPPASTPVDNSLPPPPPPAWVPPPSPPPAQPAGDSSDPFGLSSSSHFSAWNSDDSTASNTPATPAPVATEVPVATEAPVATESSFYKPASDYEKTLFGNHAEDTVENPFDKAQKLIDQAPAVESVTPKPEASPSSHFNFDEPAAASTVSTPSDPNSWMKAFDEPSGSSQKASSSSSAPVSTPVVAKTDADSSVAEELVDAFGNAKKSADSSAASNSDANKASPQADSIDKMRLLFEKNALLQQKKRGHKKGHMVSVKLHRSA